MTFAAAPSESLLTTLVHYTQLEMPDVFGLYVVTEKFIAPNTNSIYQKTGQLGRRPTQWVKSGLP